MFKTILALIAMAPLALAQTRDLDIPVVRGKPGTDDTKAADKDVLFNYGGEKGRHEAAVAAFQAAYRAASAPPRDRPMRLLLISLRREVMPKALYDLGILCARDYRWDDALKFQRAAQQQTTDHEVSKLAGLEIERLLAVMDLESTPDGQQQRTFDILFLPIFNKMKPPFTALHDLNELAKRYNRWEAFALEGILYASAEVRNFFESQKALTDAARLAPSDRRQQLEDAAKLARGEANFKEQEDTADGLWEKQRYEDAAKDYRTAWENSREHLDVALKAVTGFLMADNVDTAVQTLADMRVSATGEMDHLIGAMLKELAPISDQAKIRPASTADTSGCPSDLDTASCMRLKVGELTTPKMLLAAAADPLLLDDKTDISHVPDAELTGKESNLPLLSGESVYAIYTRDLPVSSAPPAAVEPYANPSAPVAPRLPPPATVEPVPLVNLPPPLPPSSAEPARTSVEIPHGPGDLPVSVISVPPGAIIAFDGYNNLNCTAPCQISLAAGRHTLRATLVGYRDSLGVFNVERGKTPPPVKVSLDAKLGFVTVESKIAGLPIYVNGQKTDYLTPGRLKLREGVYKVSVEIDGNMVTQEVTVQDGALIKIPF